MNPHRLTRRQFARTTALAAGALAFPFVSSRNVLGANERLHIAGIGCGGKGASDISNVDYEDIYALCDVDEATAAGTFKKYPRAKRYKDFRVMLEKEKSIDAVTVSTPDHMHAPAALLAMKLGKHVYCQKPLTHSVAEARAMLKASRAGKLATQMGNQGHANPQSRRLVELIRGGALGEVREAHVWTDRPIWPQGIATALPGKPVPASIDWDLWIGVAPMRAYHPDYAPFKWRGWWDFGTGALGDMGCHNLDVLFWALQLGAPASVSATSSGVNSQTAPSKSVVTYEFRKSQNHGALKLVWYDGGNKPPAELVKGAALSDNGAIFVGSKDTLLVPGYWGGGGFMSGAKAGDFKSIPEFLPKPENFESAHHREWTDAIRGGPAPYSNFEYAANLTESVLLGNVALRSGQKIEWDSANLKVTNVPAANQFIRREWRAGWDV